MRQHASAYVSIRQHTSAYVSIRQHTSAYVSIRQLVGGVAPYDERLLRELECQPLLLQRMRAHGSTWRQRAYTCAYVSIRQHTSAYVSIRMVAQSVSGASVSAYLRTYATKFERASCCCNRI
jgi:hypothetical protein